MASLPSVFLTPTYHRPERAYPSHPSSLETRLYPFSTMVGCASPNTPLPIGKIGYGTPSHCSIVPRQFFPFFPTVSHPQKPLHGRCVLFVTSHPS